MIAGGQDQAADLVKLVGGTGIEPVTSSVSGKLAVSLTLAQWALNC